MQKNVKTVNQYLNVIDRIVIQLICPDLTKSSVKMMIMINNNNNNKKKKNKKITIKITTMIIIICYVFSIVVQHLLIICYLESTCCRSPQTFFLADLTLFGLSLKK